MYKINERGMCNMRDIAFKATDAKMMMLHQDDIMFGLFGRIYGQIQAMAYDGNYGTEVSVPCGLIKYAEFEMRLQEMIDNGFTVCEGQVIDGEYVFDVYWD